MSEERTSIRAGTVSCHKTRKLKILKSLHKLIHACKCTLPNCEEIGCNEMKGLVIHFKVCTNKHKQKECNLCAQLLALCLYHAKSSKDCEAISCAVPHCARIKLRLKIKNGKSVRRPPLSELEERLHAIRVSNGSDVSLGEGSSESTQPSPDVSRNLNNSESSMAEDVYPPLDASANLDNSGGDIVTSEENALMDSLPSTTPSSSNSDGARSDIVTLGDSDPFSFPDIFPSNSDRGYSHFAYVRAQQFFQYNTLPGPSRTPNHNELASRNRLRPPPAHAFVRPQTVPQNPQTCLPKQRAERPMSSIPPAHSQTRPLSRMGFYSMTSSPNANYLKKLVHAQQCLSEEERGVARWPCFEADCAVTKSLIAHVSRCQGGGCMRTDCSQARILLNHWANCKNIRCALCAPLRSSAHLDTAAAAPLDFSDWKSNMPATARKEIIQYGVAFLTARRLYHINNVISFVKKTEDRFFHSAVAGYDYCRLIAGHLPYFDTKPLVQGYEGEDFFFKFEPTCVAVPEHDLVRLFQAVIKPDSPSRQSEIDNILQLHPPLLHAFRNERWILGSRTCFLPKVRPFPQ